MSDTKLLPMTGMVLTMASEGFARGVGASLTPPALWEEMSRALHPPVTALRVKQLCDRDAEISAAWTHQVMATGASTITLDHLAGALWWHIGVQRYRVEADASPSPAGLVLRKACETVGLQSIRAWCLAPALQVINIDMEKERSASGEPIIPVDEMDEVLEHFRLFTDTTTPAALTAYWTLRSDPWVERWTERLAQFV